jgi:hypothetical protein
MWLDGNHLAPKAAADPQPMTAGVKKTVEKTKERPVAKIEDFY